MCTTTFIMDAMLISCVIMCGNANEAMVDLSNIK